MHGVSKGYNNPKKDSTSKKNTIRYAFSVNNKKVFFHKAMPEAIESLKSTDKIHVDINKNDISFIAKSNNSHKGLIIYPGAFIDIRAYAPLANKLASYGHNVIIVEMPFGIGMLGVNKAKRPIREFSHIKDWVIAGHSDGGVMASVFVRNNTNLIKGIAFLGSYPLINLNNSNVKGLSILASKDQITHLSLAKKHMNKLPFNSDKKLITGGNHSNFGYYGFQNGDGKSDITREDQQYIIFNSLNKFLTTL